MITMVKTSFLGSVLCPYRTGFIAGRYENATGQDDNIFPAGQAAENTV